MIHLAHVTGAGLEELLDMDAGDLADWVEEATEYHNQVLVPKEPSA